MVHLHVSLIDYGENLIIVLLSITPKNIHYADNFSQIFQYAKFSDSNK